MYTNDFNYIKLKSFKQISIVPPQKTKKYNKKTAHISKKSRTFAPLN